MASIQGNAAIPDISAISDGRIARSVRTRRAIVDALRALHHDGELRPTAPRVAERAGVSLRTVWQHFDDLETLFLEASRRDAEIAIEYLAPIDATAPLQDRLKALVSQRAALFEAVAPTWRAARLQEPFSAQIRQYRDRLVAVGRAQVEQIFAAELDPMSPDDRRTLSAALLVATSWSVWEALRSELHLEPTAAEQAVLALTSKLLSSA